MKMSPSWTVFLAMIVLAGSGGFARAQGISWATSVDDALARAKAESKVIMVAMTMDGHRDCDAMVREHYVDAGLVKLSRHSINLFASTDTHSKSGTCSRCGSGDCAGHRNNDFNVRKKFFEVEGHVKVVVPQHLFVSADGKVICSASGRITAGELEWMWVYAIRTVDAKFQWTPAGRYRAPTSFKKAEVDKSENRLGAPPTKREVADAIKEARKASTSGNSGRRGRGRGRRTGSSIDEWLNTIVRSDSPKALQFVQSVLKSDKSGRSAVVRKIGTYSSIVWAKLVTPWLSTTESGTVRETSVWALKKLVDPKSANALKRLYRREKDEAPKGRILRSMATVAPTDGVVISQIKKALQSDKSEVVRAHATVAAGILEDRAAVTECLRTALSDSTMLVRSVAAYVIAVRQDRELSDALRSTHAAEIDAESKEWMEKAQTTIRESDPKPFEEFLKKTLDQRPTGRGRRGRRGR